jgi:hypothetical protein
MTSQYGRVFLFTSSVLILTLTSCKNKPEEEAPKEEKIVIVNDPSTSSPSTLLCPQNYVKIPANAQLGTQAFCLMKYEARKNNSLIAAESNETLPLYRNLTMASAKIACEELNTATNSFTQVGSYSLMTNAQWMSMARNLESVSTNQVMYKGTQCYKRGNTGMDLYTGYNSRCGYGLGQHEVSGANTLKFHTTSMGETIYDVSGNLFEFVRWSKNSDEAPACPSSDGWIPVNKIGSYCPQLTENDYMPMNQALNYTNGIGEAFLGGGVIAFRSGYWGSYSEAGIYLLNFCSEETANSSIGFRCAYELK